MYKNETGKVRLEWNMDSDTKVMPAGYFCYGVYPNNFQNETYSINRSLPSTTVNELIGYSLTHNGTVENTTELTHLSNAILVQVLA